LPFKNGISFAALQMNEELFEHNTLNNQYHFSFAYRAWSWIKEATNEEVTFGNNSFSVGKCLSYHGDGSGGYQYRNFSATAHRICRTTGSDRDPGYVCLRCP
jgi:hypothetical protein